jgi:hypothetical protein
MTIETPDQEMLILLREAMTQIDRPWKFDPASKPIHAIFDFTVEASGKTYRCTATAVNHALRLSVQAIVEGDESPDRLRRLDELNAKWGLGRVYLDRSHGDFDVAAGVYLGHGVPGGHLLREVLLHLINAGDSIRRFEAPVFRPRLQSTSTVSLTNIEALLRAEGLECHRRDDREVLGLRLALSAELDFVMEFQIDTNQGLRVTARQLNPLGLASDDGAYAHLQEINRGLHFGTMTYDRGHGRFVYTMMIPLGWFAFDARLAQWIIRQAARVISQLEKDERR